MHPMGLKFVLKVFGRGFGGEPFLRKVSPDKYIYFYIVTTLTSLFVFTNHTRADRPEEVQQG